jgi:hypothetical protein
VGRLGACLLSIIAALALTSSPAAAGGAFSNWAAIFVAGDDHAHSGARSEVFDNARRDLAIAFAKAGFSPAYMAQFSVHPEDYPTQNVLPAVPVLMADKLGKLAAQAKGGCLIYITSHGGPDGVIVLGPNIFTSAGVAGMIDDACGERPTVVVVSACYSGAFIPPLSAPNRLILTAARPDRTSFGCGESDRYTFFDTCMLSQLPSAHDFLGLGRAVQACVAKREQDMGVSPPSEPQMWVGPSAAPDMPLLSFASSP